MLVIKSFAMCREKTLSISFPWPCASQILDTHSHVSIENNNKETFRNLLIDITLKIYWINALQITIRVHISVKNRNWYFVIGWRREKSIKKRFCYCCFITAIVTDWYGNRSSVCNGLRTKQCYNIIIITCLTLDDNLLDYTCKYLIILRWLIIVVRRCNTIL